MRMVSRPDASKSGSVLINIPWLGIMRVLGGCLGILIMVLGLYGIFTISGFSTFLVWVCVFIVIYMHKNCA